MSARALSSWSSVAWFARDCFMVFGIGLAVVLVIREVL